MTKPSWGIRLSGPGLLETGVQGFFMYIMSLEIGKDIGMELKPHWSKQLLALDPITVTCSYDPLPIVDWPKAMSKNSTLTANGVTVPVEVKDVLNKDGTVSATLVFSGENYQIIKKAIGEMNGKEN